MPDEALLERWWGELDEFTRHRVLRLRPADLLPADLARALRARGIHVTRLTGTIETSDGDPETDDEVWAQPEVLLEFLAHHDERRPG